MRALPFTIGFLGFMYFDTHTSLFPRSEVRHFPGSDMLVEREVERWPGSSPIFFFLVILLCLAPWRLFSCMRDLEKPFSAVSGGMVQMLGITKLQAPTLQVALKSGREQFQACKWGPTGTQREKNLCHLAVISFLYILLPLQPPTRTRGVA